eukprot:TRINITY_DN83317_c0_g1_i1.p1 TRINITY_DN83317_c0_g1~~TRINITY_DN83317_c0_g1_i1.p1  ORF type:complete len:100 (+),score=15.47 TRINITY_DN83317_c0_g1_i1:47-301(+)
MGGGNWQQSAKGKGGSWQQSGRGKGSKGSAETYGQRWSPQDVWTPPITRYTQPGGGGLYQRRITVGEKIAQEKAAKEAIKKSGE